MKPRVNLYSVLGLDRGGLSRIRDDEIEYHVRRSYRREAKRLHPDTGGTAEDFSILQTALAVLSDPRRRAHYDATGEVDETPVDNDLARAISQIGKIITAIVEDMTKGAPIDNVNVLGIAIGKLTVAATQATKDIAALDIRIAAKAALENRIKRKKPMDYGQKETGPDVVKLAFRGYMDGIKAEREMLIEKRDSMVRAADLLADYTYDFTPGFGRYGT